MGIKITTDMLDKIIHESKEFKPLIVDWDITYRCPCDCVHCYQKNNRHIPELKKEIIFDTIDKLEKLGTLRYTVSGGDPLIRTDIFDILKYMSKTNAMVVLYTSGYYLDDETCEKLAEVNISRVETTLLGPDEKTHESLSRCPGGFRNICNGVDKLRELGIDYGVKYINMPQNFSERGKIDELSKRLGVEIYPSAQLWCQHDGQESEIEPYRLTEEQLYDHFKLFPKVPFPNNMLSCGAGKYRVGISADGIVMPCGTFTRKYTCGNICEKSFEDIWKNSDLLKGFRSQIRYPASKCRRCKAIEFCNPCIAAASWANKNIYEPYEPACKCAFAAKKVSETNKDSIEII